MSIQIRIEDALFLYKNGRFEGSYSHSVLVAVAITASIRFSDQNTLGDRESFEAFLDKRRRGAAV